MDWKGSVIGLISGLFASAIISYVAISSIAQSCQTAVWSASGKPELLAKIDWYCHVFFPKLFETLPI